MELKISQKILSNMETAAFCRQIALILQSGISSLEGITMMKEDARSDEERNILTAVEAKLIETGSFCEALRAANVFPEYMVHMTDIGEQSGKLDEVMSSLGIYYEREASITSALKNAVTYPFIMTVMMLVVVLVLIMKVLPIFQQVFRQLGHELTGLSQGILNLGTFLNQYSILITCVGAAVIMLFFFFAFTAGGGRIFSSACKRLGLNRKTNDKINACRFASAMSLILSSGLNTDQGMELTETLIDDPAFTLKLEKYRELTSEGVNFSDALHKASIFTGIYSRMVHIAYRTGSLDQIMKTIADQYQEELDSRINRVIAVLEPTLVAVLSIIVGVILLSVMLPLMGIMAGI